MDVLSTTYALQTGIASEANPLALFLFESFGPMGLAIPKAIATIGITILMYLMKRTWDRGVVWSQAGTLAVMTAVVVNNLLVIS